MAVVVDRVMNMVRDEISKRPEVTTRDLFEKAKKMDKGMNSLSVRQFNATYPLQVRRTMVPRRKRGTGARGKKAELANRDQVRAVLLQFAREVAAAEDKGRLVDVIGNLDSWVERVGGGSAAKTRRRRRTSAEMEAARQAAGQAAPAAKKRGRKPGGR